MLGPAPPPSLLNAPNLLSLSRLPLAVLLFALIAYHQWAAGLAVFLVATATDMLDGWLARRWDQVSAVGRALDPLTDKLLVCGAFIYLLPVGDLPDTGLRPWMVTVVVGREILITGVRGMVEAAGRSFGADAFGKLKTVLQCVLIAGLLAEQALRGWEVAVPGLGPAILAVTYVTVLATVGSGVQYLHKAAKLLG
jgi:CDP-diacylglycerol--glycerol-3-phosphate 3-phosphatidyltransferase